MRILSNNQWRHDDNTSAWSERGEDCSAEHREKGFSEVYAKLLPDAVGLQEVSPRMLDCLMRELQTDVSLRVNDTQTTDSFEVCGRGELHLSILIENMRRQGYEFAVSKPRVIYKEIDGVKCEPVERLIVDTPQTSAGAVIEKIGRRRGTLEHMSGMDRVRLEFLVPSRGLFGYRSEFMTDTRGEGIMSSVFERYEPVKGDIPHRNAGALICFETGVTTSYGLFYSQERGTLFIGAGEDVYMGQICGQNARPGDLVVNVCKQKHVTNMHFRASPDA